MRKLLTLTAAIALLPAWVAPALAYPDGYGYGYGHRHGGDDVVIYEPAPVYAAPVYAAPAYPPPYYGQPYPAYAPPPGYYQQPPVAPAPQAIQCTNGANPFGMLLGGVAGGLIGSTVGRGGGQAAAIIGGAVAGGAIGAAVPQYCSQQVFSQVPVGTPVSWQNQTVVPTRDWRTNGQHCREYQASVDVGGQQQQSYGTACLQPDGTWQIQN